MDATETGSRCGEGREGAVERRAAGLASSVGQASLVRRLAVPRAKGLLFIVHSCVFLPPFSFPTFPSIRPRHCVRDVG